MTDIPEQNQNIVSNINPPSNVDQPLTTNVPEVLPLKKNNNMAFIIVLIVIIIFLFICSISIISFLFLYNSVEDTPIPVKEKISVMLLENLYA